ncbi:MAG: SHOCT domain-containing protein [Ruminiclostridium sp.]|nr:SHOCT domain-containing protein [Ruminiclostridium sp.]
MHYMDWFWWVISILFWATVWGFATNSVIKNKGYDDNWFWWGFLFGLIAFIVALTKPEVYYNSQNYQHQENRLINNYHSYEFEHLADTVGNDTEKPGTFKNGYWKCQCGNYNPTYRGVCSVCAMSLSEIKEIHRRINTVEQLQISASNRQPQIPTSKTSDDSVDDIDMIKKYKQLLDMGAITQEEYDTKKKKLLGI